MRYYILGIFIFTILNTSFGQNIGKDSTVQYTDTVIIYKEPLIVRKKVFVETPTLPNPNWYLELLFGLGFFKNHYQNKTFEVSLAQDLNKAHDPKFNGFLQLLIFRTFERIDVGIGIKAHYYQEKFDYNLQSISTDSTKYLRTDTIDTYYNIINKDTSYFYVVETNEYTSYERQVAYERYVSKNFNLFIETPLYFKYKIVDRKVALKLILGVKPSFLVAASGKIISRSFSRTEVKQLMRRDFSSVSIRSVIGMEMSYPIRSNLKVTLSPSFDTQITSISSKAQPFTWRRNNISVQTGVQFYF